LKERRERTALERILGHLGVAQLTHFVWERGRVGFHQNPEGMRDVVRTGFLITGLAWAAAICVTLPLGMEGLLPLLLVTGVWIAAATGLLLLNIGFLSTLSGEPVHRLGAANLITLARISTLPLLSALILQGRWTAALVAYLAIAFSDVADGIIARRRHEETRLGFILDPFGDILFQVVVFMSLWSCGRVGSGTVAAALVRYGLLLFGCLALYFLMGRVWIRPTPFGRATGVALGAGTVLLLYGPISGWERDSLRLVERGITILFIAGAIQVLMIGWANIRRPAGSGQGDWRKWGLKLARPGPGESAASRGDHEGVEEER